MFMPVAVLTHNTPAMLVPKPLSQPQTSLDTPHQSAATSDHQQPSGSTSKATALRKIKTEKADNAADSTSKAAALRKIKTEKADNPAASTSSSSPAAAKATTKATSADPRVQKLLVSVAAWSDAEVAA